MRKQILCFVIIVLTLSSAWSQNLRTHVVKAGESIQSIALFYNVTIDDIYALNPDAQNEVVLNSILVIPQSLVVPTEEVELKELLSYKLYRVKRKETLSSLSRKFKVSIEDIKKHNKQLYTEPLRSKSKIYIPVFKRTTTVQSLKNTLKPYTVQPKEGKWRIAYKHGISVPELEAINPQSGPYFYEGEVINVPNIEVQTVKTIEADNYSYYKVEPKEGFYRLKVKLGLTQSELEQLNPELKLSGLKAGMILKTPKGQSLDLVNSQFETEDLSQKLKDFMPKKIALLLPFKTKSIDFDSLQLAQKQIKRDGYTSISADFYRGVLTALDSAKQLGLSTSLDVYDTNANLNDLKALLSNSDFSKYDAILGPILLSNVIETARQLHNDSIMVVSPFMKTTANFSNLYQSVPDEQWMRLKMINYIQSDTTDFSTLVISDKKHFQAKSQLMTSFPNILTLDSQKNMEGEEQFYIVLDSMKTILPDGKTFVFLESTNEGFVSNVTSMLNSLNGHTEEEITEQDGEKLDPPLIETHDRDIVLVTTSSTKAFESDNVSNIHLSNLKFHYPTARFFSEATKVFSETYKQQNGWYPNKYVIRGFDLTMDILLRLSSMRTLDQQGANFQTRYIENKFQYFKIPQRGYVNRAIYILKYDDNLDIIKVQD